MRSRAISPMKAARSVVSIRLRSKRSIHVDQTSHPSRHLRTATVCRGCEHTGPARRVRYACGQRPVVAAEQSRDVSGSVPIAGRSGRHWLAHRPELRAADDGPGRFPRLARERASRRRRALLMLFLFSDVGADDAPTRIRVRLASRHRAAARACGRGGNSPLRELATDDFVESAHRTEALAAGEAGTVYLCHPFLVHARAQPHRGTAPRFIAQPPLLPAEPFKLHRDDSAYSPVEQAIRSALS